MVKPVYFIHEINPLWPHEGEELGPITFRQEIYCWMYAKTGNSAKAVRHAYLRNTAGAVWEYGKRMRKRKAILVRIAELKEAHEKKLPNHWHPDKKVVDLNEGPWQHYGKFDEGYPLEHRPTVTSTREIIWGELGRTDAI